MKNAAARLEENTSREALQKGMEYYEKGRVKIYSMGNEHIEASVREARLHYVDIRIGPNDDVAVCDCTCGDDSGGYCKHIVATIMHVRDEMDHVREHDRWAEDGDDAESPGLLPHGRVQTAPRGSGNGAGGAADGDWRARVPVQQRIPADAGPAERCRLMLEYAYDEAKNKKGRIPNKSRIYFGLVDEMAAKYSSGMDSMETYVTAAKHVSDNMGAVDNLKGHYTVHVRHMMRRVVGLATGSAHSRDRMQRHMRQIFAMYMQDESETHAGIYLEALFKMCAKAGGGEWWTYVTGMFEAHRGGDADSGDARRSPVQVLEAEAEILTRSGQARLEDFLSEHRGKSQEIYVRYIWLLAERDMGLAAAEARKAAEAFPDSLRVADVLFHICGARGGPEYVDLLCRTFVRTYNWGHYEQARGMSAEWGARMESIMSEIRDGGNPNMCVDILLREGMDERALAEVLGSGDLDMLDAYVHELGQKYPEEFHGFYAERLPKAIKSVRSAEQYEDVRRHIAAMQVVPGHKKDAARLAEMLRRRQSRIAG